MRNTIQKEIQGCQKFIQLSIVTLLVSSYSMSVFAIDKNLLERKPANVPDEEVLLVPDFDKPLLLTIFAEDDGGVMKGMRDSISSWESTDEYAAKWNLKSTGLYNTPSADEKRRMIAIKLLKYADKRFAGEMKNAEVGSTMYNVGKVEKSLRPNTEVAIAKNFSIKFRARVLQGKAVMDIKNPWVECSTTVAATGKVNVVTKKDFKELGLTTAAEYSVNEAQWIAYADQKITENVKARLSSTQSSHTMMFENDAEKKVELTASFPVDF
jgi:hypothetical protein